MTVPVGKQHYISDDNEHNNARGSMQDKMVTLGECDRNIRVSSDNVSRSGELNAFSIGAIAAFPNAGNSFIDNCEGLDCRQASQLADEYDDSDSDNEYVEIVIGSNPCRDSDDKSIPNQHISNISNVRMNVSEKEIEQAKKAFVKKSPSKRIFRMLAYILALVGLVVGGAFKLTKMLLLVAVLIAIFLSHSLYRSCKGLAPYPLLQVVEVPVSKKKRMDLLNQVSWMSMFKQDLCESWDFFWDCLTNTKKIGIQAQPFVRFGISCSSVENTKSTSHEVMMVGIGVELWKSNKQKSTAETWVNYFRHFLNMK